jgi:hypothetical protein
MMVRIRLVLGSLAAAALLASAPALPSLAGGFTMSGQVGTELRWYPEDVEWPGQDNYHLDPSGFIEPQFHYEWDGGNDRISFVPFARGDLHDSHRSHADLREGYWLHQEQNWDALVGVNRVFWGVTESRHLVNIINQIDQVEDIDEEDFLGQPMVNVNVFDTDWGRLGFYAMSGFRKRTFPADDARLRGPLPIDEDHSEFDSDWGRANVDLALRYENTIGPVDFGIYQFHGLSREPHFKLHVKPSGAMEFIPVYDMIDQTGIDAQATLGDWLLKFEGIMRMGQGDTFFAAVGGFEYTIFDAFDSGMDIGLLSEYQYDGREHPNSLTSPAPPTAANHDVFGGVRLTFNDVDDTNILLGAVVDVDNQTTGFSVEASRRLTDNLKLELDARTFFNVASDDIVTTIDKDEFVQLRLSYFY